MANNYTQFSSSLGVLPTGAVEELNKLTENGESDDFSGGFYFEDEPDGEVIVVGEECGDLEHLATVLQAYLKAHRDDPTCPTKVAVEWANTCDKLRVDNFSGGAFVISADNEHWLNTSDWVAEMMK